MSATESEVVKQSVADAAVVESDSLLHSCIDALSSHIAVLDEDGIILAVNQAWRSFADANGFAGQNYGIGSNYVDACQPASGEANDGFSAAAGLRDVLHGRKDQFQLEYPCHSAASNRWFILRVTRALGAGPARLVVAHEDITERREAEEALRAANRNKDEFLALLAHELRNPLAPIRHVLQIMRMSGGHGQLLHSAFEIMERQIGHMVRLVDDLLDVSRISRGKLELQMENIDLASVIDLAVEASSPHIANMNHRLTVSLPSEPIRIHGDLTRLAQAVSNLLNNAAKFTDSGGSISLSVEHGEQQALIRVQDSGIGIAAEQLPLIFEMFTQVDNSLQRTQSGLGIGLMVVRSLVEMHNGTIEARSPGLGQGCEFIMRLPVCDFLPATSSEEISDKDAQPARTRRILVVDDSVDSATSLATFLQLMGNETHTAFDGLEALQVADAVQPDVVLLDIGMPRLNGYETARRIRARPWADQVVLVAVTGFGQEEDRQKARDAGFDHHMVKPIDASSLLETLDNLPVHAEQN